MGRRFPVPMTARWLCVFVLLVSCFKFGLADKSSHKNARGLNGSKVRGDYLAVEPSLTNRPRRRLAEDKDKHDKDKDKDKKDDKDATPAPTRRPTRRPSRRPTPQPTREPQSTPTPTPEPSAEPTPLPTTPSPSAPPSISPTFPQSSQEPGTSPSSPAPTELQTSTQSPSASSDGVIFLHFSLTRPTPVKAADVMTDRETELSQAVMNALLFILCDETDFIVGVDADKEGENGVCYSFRSLLADEESNSVISDDAVIQVEDGKAGELEWTEWTVAFPVLQVGDNYRQAALQLLQSNATDYEVQGVALELMRDTATAVLSSNIQDNRFDELVGSKVQTSLVGQEIETFDDIAILEGEPTQVEVFKPSGFHTLRVIGICLFILNITVGFIMLKLAARQRKRHGCKANHETNEGGALNNEAALDIMLDLGRQRYGSANLQISPSPTNEDQNVSKKFARQKASSGSDTFPSASLSPSEPFRYDSPQDNTEYERVGDDKGNSNPEESCSLDSKPTYPSPLHSSSPSLNDFDSKSHPGIGFERESDHSNREYETEYFSSTYLPESLNIIPLDHMRQYDDRD